MACYDNIGLEIGHADQHGGYVKVKVIVSSTLSPVAATPYRAARALRDYLVTQFATQPDMKVSELRERGFELTFPIDAVARHDPHAGGAHVRHVRETVVALVEGWGKEHAADTCHLVHPRPGRGIS